MRDFDEPGGWQEQCSWVFWTLMNFCTFSRHELNFPRGWCEWECEDAPNGVKTIQKPSLSLCRGEPVTSFLNKFGVSSRSSMCNKITDFAVRFPNSLIWLEPVTLFPSHCWHCTFHTTDFVALCDFCQLSVVAGKCVLGCDHTHQQRWRSVTRQSKPGSLPTVTLPAVTGRPRLEKTCWTG